MASREEILADFQACTGIEDVELAICQLEATDWVLVDAVNKALPASPETASVPNPPATSSQTSRSGPPTPPLRTDSTSLSSFGPSIAGVTVGPISSPSSSNPSPMDSSSPYSAFQGISVAEDLYSIGPSSSYGPRFRMLDFYIQHLERTFHLKVPDNEDVKTLKNLIQAETGFPPCQQSLRGFKGSSTLPPTDRRKLSELNLPKENFLHLVTPEREEDETNGEEKEKEAGDISLIVTNEINNETYTLKFRPIHTVLNIKLDVASFTDIPVSKQVWTGWPKHCSDDLSLAQLDIPNEHHLTVNRKATSPAPRSMPIVEDMDQSNRVSSPSNNPSSLNYDSDDDFEDVQNITMEDDDFFIHPSAAATTRIQPLLPDDYGDETLAGIKFSEEFANRYGSPHPLFFSGSLSDAIQESCGKPAKERKMLAIYLHHDSSVLTNVFCTQTLCAETIVTFLSENFVIYGWDLTFESNRRRAQDMIKDHFGSVAAATIRNLNIERLPVLALVYKLRGTLEIVQIIHGNVTLDEFMSQLLQAHDNYTSQIAGEIQEETEREARNAVKREQDLAFEMAQQADREKEEQKQREEEEKREKDRREAAKRASEEEEKRRLEEEKEKQRRKIEQNLPKEPSSDEAHAKIRFRVVGGGKNLERRFLPQDKLQLIFDYLTVEGYPVDEHKVLSSWPRRDLTSLDPNSTLQELKLYPQETLTLEEK